MSAPELLNCSECPYSAVTNPNGRDSIYKLAKHRWKIGDHGPDNYPEAKQEIEDNLQEFIPEGSEQTETGTEETTEPDNTQPTEPDEDEPENPMLKSPVHVMTGKRAIADGGESECPECEDELVSVQEGFGFEGVTEGGDVVSGYISDGNGDMYCPNCDILIDEENTVVYG